MEKENGLKLIKAEIKNFKNIDHRVIDFDGKSIMIIGPNKAGKSSLIQALMSPVDSSYIPLEPIKQGEEKGHINIVIAGEVNGEPVKYTVGCHFNESNKRGTITLLDKTGNQIKSGTKNILDGIIGDISFNIMDFIKLGVTDTGKRSETGVKQQIEIIKMVFIC